MQHLASSVAPNHIIDRQRGFTIVELLVVIVVIGILAAISVVAFNGVQRRAVESSMQSDIRNATAQLRNDQTNTGSFPANAAAANGGAGLKSSGNNVLSYTLKPYGYCVTVTNAATQTTFRAKSTTQTVQDGNCDVAVTTPAGSSYGDAVGAGASAQFAYPRFLAFDPEGVLYITDYGNHRIKKMATDGTVSILAGSGATGSTNATGTAASFFYPDGIDLDAAGNVYVADGSNHRIRKITPAGVVTTLAGSTQGYVDATGTSARFTFPRGVAVDANGNVFVAEESHRIRKITPAGVVTTFAGSTQGSADGTGTAAQFAYPMGIAIDDAGMLYVADSANHRVRKITPAGVVTTLAGSTQGFADGTGTAAQFNQPFGIAVYGVGNLYVTDANNHRIRLISPAGVVTTLAGSATNGSADGSVGTAQFYTPEGIAISPTGVLHVTDYNNHRIRTIDH